MALKKVGLLRKSLSVQADHAQCRECGLYRECPLLGWGQKKIKNKRVYLSGTLLFALWIFRYVWDRLDDTLRSLPASASRM